MQRFCLKRSPPESELRLRMPMAAPDIWDPGTDLTLDGNSMVTRSLLDLRTIERRSPPKVDGGQLFPGAGDMVKRRLRIIDVEAMAAQTGRPEWRRLRVLIAVILIVLTVQGWTGDTANIFVTTSTTSASSSLGGRLADDFGRRSNSDMARVRRGLGPRAFPGGPLAFRPRQAQEREDLCDPGHLHGGLGRNRRTILRALRVPVRRRFCGDGGILHRSVRLLFYGALLRKVARCPPTPVTILSIPILIKYSIFPTLRTWTP